MTRPAVTEKPKLPIVRRCGEPAYVNAPPRRKAAVTMKEWSRRHEN